MSRPNSPPSGSPHLVSLVLHSKKALQHGEQLCTRANDLSRTSSQTAVELLALDAKVKWIAQGIQDQLKLAVNVAKSIEAQRSKLEEQAKQWDKSRALYLGNLDDVLESLGSQPVPPDFYQSSSSSSLFGHPPSDDEEKFQSYKAKLDKSKWKTLRDFVDERGIEDAVEGMDNDRMALDDILCITEEHPRTLLNNVSAIRDSLPNISTLPSIEEIFKSQENVSTVMAGHLESLAAHYEQMAAALRDKEAGVEFSEDDLQDMNRDTEELPAIISELEEDVTSIESSYNLLQTARQISEQCVGQERDILGHLDELGDLMTDMLDRQQNVETECEIHLATLQSHVSTLENLHVTYTSYRTSYNSLLLEMDRRRRYHDTAEDIVREMSKQLEVIRDEEVQAREAFYSSHGPHLPDDLCLCIANMPTKWDVAPAPSESIEVLPDIDEDLIVEARKQELEQVGSGSV